MRRAIQRTAGSHKEENEQQQTRRPISTKRMHRFCRSLKYWFVWKNPCVWSIKSPCAAAKKRFEAVRNAHCVNPGGGEERRGAQLNRGPSSFASSSTPSQYVWTCQQTTQSHVRHCLCLAVPRSAAAQFSSSVLCSVCSKRAGAILNEQTVLNEQAFLNNGGGHRRRRTGSLR